jgi:hypothetical protein
MKTLKSGFLAFMVAFALQNANAGDTIYLKHPLKHSYILWRVQFYQDPMKPTIKNFAIAADIEIDSLFIGKIDSVLRGDFFTNEKWTFYLTKKEMEKRNIKRNTGYLVLSSGLSRLKASECIWSNFLHIEREELFPDTPENRKKLSKKWDETTVIYKYPEPIKPKELVPLKDPCLDEDENP